MMGDSRAAGKPAKCAWSTGALTGSKPAGAAGCHHKGDTAYLEAEDLVSNWITECCLVDPNAQDTIKRLYTSYKEWAERALSERRLGDAFEDRGYQRDRAARARGHVGIKVRTEMHETGALAEMTEPPLRGEVSQNALRPEMDIPVSLRIVGLSERGVQCVTLQSTARRSGCRAQQRCFGRTARGWATNCRRQNAGPSASLISAPAKPSLACKSSSMARLSAPSLIPALRTSARSMARPKTWPGSM